MTATEAIDEALKILHEEGWLGKSEQRIRAIVYPEPKGEVEPDNVGLSEAAE